MPTPSDTLPAVLAEVARVAGPVTALRLAEAHGGTRIWMPEADNIRDGHWLAQLVGLEHARAIAAHFGAGPLDVPLGPAASRARMWQRLQERLAEGQSANDVARALGVDRTTVFRHKAGKSGGAETDQHRLF